MKSYLKFSTAIVLILAITACSLTTKVIDSDMVIMTTNNSDLGIVLSNKNGEALILATETGADGKISNVTSASWVSPEKKTITVYFEDGLPTYAVAEGNLVYFLYNNDDTVNITIISPDGAKSTTTNVPVDTQRIPKINSMNSKSGPHLALIKMQSGEMTSKGWARFASIAFGVFSCTATIASGGTLSILFGVGCAATIYTIWATSQGEESPVLDSTATGVSIGQCAIGVAQKNPISVADCASSIIDIGAKITESDNTIVAKNESIIEAIRILGEWSLTWTWNMVCQDTCQGTLTLNEDNTASQCAEGAQCNDATWTMSGNTISWTISDSDCYATYTGTITGNTISGTNVTTCENGGTGQWSAQKIK